MTARFDIFRKNPGEKTPRRQIFEIDVQSGMTVLDVFHLIQQQHAPSFAYRYSCRGAICGSCAVRINGNAALACKIQAAPLAEAGTVVVDPLTNMGTVKDLVADHTVFWEAYNKVRPYLERLHDRHDEQFTWNDKLKPQALDQLSRSIDCIKCAACFSDCPKRSEDERFIGPQASVQMYKFYMDPRDNVGDFRKTFSAGPGGVIACDSHAACVKVCPKDVRPLRAISFIKRDLESNKEKSR